MGTLGISDNGDTLFGVGIDPNGLNQGWVANFPVGYLRNVQTFTSSNPNMKVNITGGSIGRDGNYSANNIVVGGPIDGVSLNTPSGSRSVTNAQRHRDAFVRRNTDRKFV